MKIAENVNLRGLQERPMMRRERRPEEAGVFREYSRGKADESGLASQ